MNDTQAQILGALMLAILALQIVQTRHMQQIRRRLRRLMGDRS